MLRTDRSPSHTVMAATIGVVMVGYFCSLAVNWPGHLEFDSIRQLLEGRRGLYANWHPPLMSFLLGIGDAIFPGGALFVLLDTSLAFGAMVFLVVLSRKPSRFSPLFAAACVALPQFFLFQAIVWKDILFGDLTLLGFVLIGFLGTAAARRQTALKILTPLVFALAILSRQNGATILPCAAIAWYLNKSRSSDSRQAARSASVFVLLTVIFACSMHLGLQTRASKALGPREQVEDLQLYDIAGMLQHDPTLSLPILQTRAPGMAALLQEHGPRLYSPAGQDPLVDFPPTGRLIISSRDPVNRQWQALVLSNLGTYLSVRARDFLWLLLGRDPKLCSVYQVGVDGDPLDLKAAHLTRRYDGRDRWLGETYATTLAATPLLSHDFYALLGLFSFVCLVRRRRPADLAMACLIGAAAMYCGSFFFIAISCEYRYLFLLDLAVIAATFHLAMDSAGIARDFSHRQ